MEHYTAIKNSKSLSFVTTWMELECTTLSKVKSVSERQICGRNKTDEHSGREGKVE